MDVNTNVETSVDANASTSNSTVDTHTADATTLTNTSGNDFTVGYVAPVAEEGKPAIEEQLHATNTRLLEESRRNKLRYQEAQKKLEALENAKMAEQGKYRELFEAEKSKNEKLLQGLIKERVRSAVQKKAEQAGCLNVDALLKLGNTELLQYDDESMQVVGEEHFVERAQQDHPYLFQPKTQSVVNTTSPGAAKSLGEGQKDLSGLSQDEIMARLRALQN